MLIYQQKLSFVLLLTVGAFVGSPAVCRADDWVQFTQSYRQSFTHWELAYWKAYEKPDIALVDLFNESEELQPLVRRWSEPNRRNILKALEELETGEMESFTVDSLLGTRTFPKKFNRLHLRLAVLQSMESEGFAAHQQLDLKSAVAAVRAKSKNMCLVIFKSVPEGAKITGQIGSAKVNIPGSTNTAHYLAAGTWLLTCYVPGTKAKTTRHVIVSKSNIKTEVDFGRFGENGLAIDYKLKPGEKLITIGELKHAHASIKSGAIYSPFLIKHGSTTVPYQIKYGSPSGPFHIQYEIRAAPVATAHANEEEATVPESQAVPEPELAPEAK